MFAAFRKKIEKIRPWVPAIAFFCGFSWDNLTLKRVDNTIDMAIFGAFLLLSGAAVVCIGREARFRFSPFLPAAAQFLFGGLFSSFFVYYIKSASSTPSLLFVFFLVVLLVGNEFVEKKLRHSTLSGTLFGISCFMYLNAVLPVFLRTMNVSVFLLAVALSFGLVAILRKLSRPGAFDPRPVTFFYAVIIAFYFFNVIPPVPLAKKEMGIYRSVEKIDNSYVCAMTKPPWYRFLRKSEEIFAYAAGDTVFCFSSIYAPARLTKKIFHHWYFKNPQTGTYRETDRMGYRLTGGRDNGYRGYTFKKNMASGTWKVVLKTEDGKVLGIAKFGIVQRDTLAALALKTTVY